MPTVDCVPILSICYAKKTNEKHTKYAMWCTSVCIVPAGQKTIQGGGGGVKCQPLFIFSIHCLAFYHVYVAVFILYFNVCSFIKFDITAWRGGVTTWVLYTQIYTIINMINRTNMQLYIKLCTSGCQIQVISTRTKFDIQDKNVYTQ